MLLNWESHRNACTEEGRGLGIGGLSFSFVFEARAACSGTECPVSPDQDSLPGAALRVSLCAWDLPPVAPACRCRSRSVFDRPASPPLLSQRLPLPASVPGAAAAPGPGHTGSAHPGPARCGLPAPTHTSPLHGVSLGVLPSRWQAALVARVARCPSPSSLSFVPF